jgi:hypothetical protein
MIDLDKILALEAQATPGPWALVVDTAPLTLYLNDNFVQAERKEDIDLISAMRNSTKELCAELRAAREVVQLTRSHIKYCSEKALDHELSNALKQYEEARQG